MKKGTKKKEKIASSDMLTPIDIEHNENKTLEIIKSWSYGIFWVVVVLSIFSGFKYPWKWIDALYETENEKIEIIADKWNNAYSPLVTWCANNSQVSTNLKYNYRKNNKIEDIKNYIISSSGNEKSCLENKDFRIELINSPTIEVKENEILNQWFSEIPPHLENFNFTIEENTNYKTEQFRIETNLFRWSDILAVDENDFDIENRSQIICAYSKNVGHLDDRCSYRIGNYFDEEEQEDDRMKYFSINFLNQKDFVLLSKGCFNGCIAEITYFYDMKKHNIRGIKILQPNLKTWPKYLDKDSSKVKEYDSLINKTHFIVNELEKNYLKPEWFRGIEIK